MNKKNEDRGALIDRMFGTRNEREVEAAEKDGEGWLRENPDDVRVIAASERLAKTGVRVRDSESRADRRSLSLLAVVFSSVALATSALTGSLYAALAAGLLIALPLTEFVWELLHDRSVDAARRDGER